MALTLPCSCRKCGTDIPTRSGSGRKPWYCYECKAAARAESQAAYYLRRWASDSYDRSRSAVEARRAARTPRLGQHCGLCLDMPWRVDGPACVACGLEHGGESVLVPSGLRSTFAMVLG